MNEAMNEERTIIPPHTYPLAFKIILLLSAIFLIYFCLTLLPKYNRYYLDLHLADRAFLLKDYSCAYKGYKELLKKLNTKEMQIKMAKTCFALNKPEKAFEALADLALTHREWGDINRYSIKKYELQLVVREKE